MGWTFCKAWTVYSIIEQFITPYEVDEKGKHISVKALANFYHPTAEGSELYVAKESTTTEPGKAPIVHRYIVVVLIENSSNGWGYKSMDCCMGAHVNSCSKEILDLCPPHNGAWCQMFHDRNRKALAENIHPEDGTPTYPVNAIPACDKLGGYNAR